ncbi:hypothetical protein [Aquimarina macrocephali]|uniref:hypothetical protein n=1 Tax=Aquimarina macrocephali TaxID=666563 RepID=UPI003F67D4E4
MIILNIKKNIFLLLLSLSGMQYTVAQHCGWGAMCHKILILEKEAIQPNHEYVIQLLDSTYTPVKDINNDIVSFFQQKKNTTLPSYTMHDVSQNLEEFSLKNFSDLNYFVTLFQSCNDKNYHLKVENKTVPHKQIIDLEPKHFQTICSSYIKVNLQDKTLEIYDAAIEKCKDAIIKLK